MLDNNTCANCGKSINDTNKTIVGGCIPEDKWVCSDLYYDDYNIKIKVGEV